MGTSTNANICYGIVLEDGYECPWDGLYEGDIEAWWLAERGFKHSFEIFDADGNYLEGAPASDDAISNYFQEERAFQKANPIPVELVNYCSNDFPMYVIAVPGTVVTALRGNPTPFNPDNLLCNFDAEQAFLAFCKHYDFPESRPGWVLSSYWG